MNKVSILKEVAKLAAYAFVTAGLAGTTLVQFQTVAALVKPAVVEQ